jgi:hypothetical protein
MKYALLLLALSAGCSDNDLSLSIVQMEALEAPTCIANPGIGTGLSRGVYDVKVGANFARGYIGVPLIRNNQGARNPSGQLEYNSVQITGINVDLQFPDSIAAKIPANDERYLHFYYPAAAGRIDPANLAPTFVEILPRQLMSDLAQAGLVPTAIGGAIVTVVAKLRPVGMQQSDQVVGGPLWFPVDICFGCLTFPAGACPLPAGTTVSADGCNPQQDTVQTCCGDPNAPTCGSTAVATAM